MATKNNRGKKWFFIVGAIVILGILGIAAKSFGVLGRSDMVEVKVGKSELRTIYARVTESGVIEPTIDVPVAPDVSGEVVAIEVREGEDVKKGDLLVTIQPDDYVAILEQARAGLNQAQANQLQAQARVSEAEATLMQDSIALNRTRQLYKEKVVSQVELENAELKFNVSKSQLNSSRFSVRAAYFQVKNAEATVKQARQNLDRTNIYASMDGTITMLNVELGQRVVGTRQMAGTEILKVADLSNMEVVAEINENDIINVSLGDSAKVEVDAFPGETFYGKVSEIAYSAATAGLATSDQVTNFEVKVAIDPKSYLDTGLTNRSNRSHSPFRPGMTALVEIYTHTEFDVVGVPIQAVTLDRSEKKDSVETDNQNREIVFLFEDGKALARSVETGISDDEYIHIKSGIDTGQQVITGPYTILTKELKDGMDVEEMEAEKKGSRWGRR